MKFILFSLVIVCLTSLPTNTKASFFTDVNKDAMSGEISKGATGPRIGFEKGAIRAYKAISLANSQYSIERAMHEVENKQIEILQDLGINDLPIMSSRALEIARFYEGGGTPEQAHIFDAYIQALSRYNILQLKLS